MEIFKVQKEPLTILIYGTNGTGKTRLAATAPSPVFLDIENKMDSTSEVNKNVKRIRIKTVGDFNKAFEKLEKEKSEYETVVVDSLTSLNELVIEDEKDLKNGKMLGFDGHDKVKTRTKKMIDSLNNLDKHTVFIAKDDEINNGSEIYRVLPFLSPKALKQNVCDKFKVVAYLWKEAQQYFITSDFKENVVTRDVSAIVQNELDISKWIERNENFLKKCGTKKEHKDLAPEFKK